MKNIESCGGIAAELKQAVQLFATDESSAKELVNRLAASNPALFFPAAIRIVAGCEPSEGSRQLLLTIAKDRRLTSALLDTGVCTNQEAIAVTRLAAEAGAQLQPAFELALNKALQAHASPQNAERILRLLDVLAVLPGQSWNAYQVELMAYPDSIVRAKAALVIGRSTRNVPWIARRLLDRDPRVQASGVEALWGLDPEETKPHLLSALDSGNNRVVANAAFGLYLIGHASVFRILMKMLQNPDPAFQASALWAMGETQDERFLPVLSDFYKSSAGKLRLSAVGAMSKIRRRERAGLDRPPLRIHLAQALVQPDGRRHLAVGISCSPPCDLTGIKPAHFALWENEKLIEEYAVRLVSPPAVLLVGFIAPWFASAEEPYGAAVREALRKSLLLKRPDDMWRIDHYSIEMNPGNNEKSAPESVFPYDDALLTPELKAAHGCTSDASLLTKVIASPVPRERAAADPLAAVERQCTAFAKRGGKRHLFLFLHEMSGFDLKQEAAIARLRAIAKDNNAILHGICPDVAGHWDAVRALCLANSEGTFSETPLAGMAEAFVDAYGNLSNRFEIDYSLSPADAPGAGRLKISSAYGNGQISFHLSPAAEPASVQQAPSPASAA